MENHRLQNGTLKEMSNGFVAMIHSCKKWQWGVQSKSNC
jgi:hypothetical protein